MNQSKKDAEQREREHQLRREEMAMAREDACAQMQLRREEMAIAREDARAQRQLMNVMMMAVAALLWRGGHCVQAALVVVVVMLNRKRG